MEYLTIDIPNIYLNAVRSRLNGARIEYWATYNNPDHVRHGEKVHVATSYFDDPSFESPHTNPSDGFRQMVAYPLSTGLIRTDLETVYPATNIGSAKAFHAVDHNPEVKVYDKEDNLLFDADLGQNRRSFMTDDIRWPARNTEFEVILPVGQQNVVAERFFYNGDVFVIRTFIIAVEFKG